MKHLKEPVKPTACYFRKKNDETKKIKMKNEKIVSELRSFVWLNFYFLFERLYNLKLRKFFYSVNK